MLGHAVAGGPPSLRVQDPLTQPHTPRGGEGGRGTQPASRVALACPLPPACRTQPGSLSKGG